MTLSPVIIENTSWALLNNGSIMQAMYSPYTMLIGDWFWIIMLLFLMIITYIRTQDWAYMFSYGLLGMVALGIYGFMPMFFKPIMYLILAISLMLTLYAFFVKTEK